MPARERRFAAVFRALSHRNYRLFFGGQSISLVGTWMQRIAMGWLVYRLTNSPFLLGLVGFTGQIPTFLFAPLGGVLGDRWDRRRTLVITQTLATLQAGVLAALTMTGVVAVWHIVLLSIFLGLVNACDIPVRQSFVVEMIEDRRDLGNAIALNSSMVNGARLLGPSIAGILIAVVGEGVCFLLNAVSYLAVIWALLAMRTRPTDRHDGAGHILHRFKEGFAYAFGFAPTRYVILLLALVSLTGVPYQILMPPLARDVLHGGASTLGFLVAAGGAGAIVGGMYLASRRSVVGLGRMIALAAGIFGAGLIGLSLCRALPVALLLMPIAGFGMMVQMASSNTTLQAMVDDDKRARVMAFYTMAFMGMAPFGSIMAGALASRIGVARTLLVGGVCCVLGALLFARKLPVLRELVRPVYARKGVIPEAPPPNGTTGLGTRDTPFFF
jgi:MFS family permease